MDLFGKGGSRGTPMAAIAERIGVSIPAINHHFGSRNGLFLEVVAVSDSIDEIRTTQPQLRAGIDRVGAIRSWAHAISADSSVANLARLTLVMTAEALDADFPAHDHFVARHRRFRQQIADAIIAGQDDGTVRHDVDPFSQAIEILSFVQGTLLQWHLDPEAIDLLTVFDLYFDRLVFDLVPGAAAPMSGARAKGGSGRRRPGTKGRSPKTA